MALGREAPLRGSYEAAYAAGGAPFQGGYGAAYAAGSVSLREGRVYAAGGAPSKGQCHQLQERAK